MPDAVCVPNAPRWLSPRCAGLRNARASSWSVLRRLLLGTDGVVIRGRRHERALDCPPRVTRSHREGHLLWPPDRSRCWHSPDSGRCVVISDGNVLTEQEPSGGRTGGAAP